MAHQIEENDTMISVRETPWHRLGTVLPDYIPTAEAIELAGLNFTVEESQVFLTNGKLIPKYKALYRAHPHDTEQTLPLGIVGENYGIVQPAAMTELLTSLLAESEDGLRIETAGTLRSSRVAWIQAKLGEDTIVEDDPHVPYLFVANSWDGSQAFRVMAGQTRVVCANTLAWATKNARTAYTFRHSAGITARIEDVRGALRMVHEASEQFQAEVETLLAEHYTNAQFAAMVERLLPIAEDATKVMVAIRNNRRDAIHSVWDDPNGAVAHIKNTAYGAVMAVSDVELWGKELTSKRAERQIINMLNGNQKMLSAARALVG